MNHREAREASTYLAWQSHFGVTLQVGRLRDPDAEKSPGSGWFLVDVTGLILALWRLRLAAQMSIRVEGRSDEVTAALARFDGSLPNLAKLRHVTMHFDNYALGSDQRQNTIGDPARPIEIADLWKFRRLADGFEWLEVQVQYGDVEREARYLYDAIQHENNTQLD